MALVAVSGHFWSFLVVFGHCWQHWVYFLVIWCYWHPQEVVWNASGWCLANGYTLKVILGIPLGMYIDFHNIKPLIYLIK